MVASRSPQRQALAATAARCCRTAAIAQRCGRLVTNAARCGGSLPTAARHGRPRQACGHCGPLLAPDRFREPYLELDKETATFFAMIATVDERLATFIEMLEAEVLREDTILVFLTDSADPSQESDIAAEQSDVVARLRAHYDEWWAGVQPLLGLERYRLGATREVKLTAYDWWYVRRVYNWPHLRRGDTSNGRYEVVINQTGRYTVTLRRWPRESEAGICDGVPHYVPGDPFMAYDGELAPFPPAAGLDIAGARVLIGGQEESMPVKPTDQEVTLNFDLQAGETDVQTWFKTQDGEEFGANYVYITSQ